eukprot:2829853-Amphidinium_carterae.2
MVCGCFDGWTLRDIILEVRCSCLGKKRIVRYERSYFFRPDAQADLGCFRNLHALIRVIDLRTVKTVNTLDREEALAIVPANGLIFNFVPESCRGDREIVLAAVRRDGRALEYASESCRGDREIVLAAIQQDGRALKYASESCRGDREIVLAAIQEDFMAVQYASESCKQDSKIQEAAQEAAQSKTRLRLIFPARTAVNSRCEQASLKSSQSLRGQP